MLTLADWFAGLHAATWQAQLARDADLARRLDVARAYIDRHFDTAIDLDAIAAAAFSRFHVPPTARLRLVTS